MNKFLTGLCALLVATFAVAQERMPLSAFPQATLQIATPDARLHRFNIWEARDDRHRAQGLMFVTDLPPDSGMLFIYPAPQRIAMWMKNTLIPLDMLFIDANGRVVSIAANTMPMSEKIIEGEYPVVAVLELKGGVAANLNIAKGAVVKHPLFERGSRH